jgi:hypothetical protein
MKVVEQARGHGVEVVLVYRSHLLGADRAVCNIYDTIQQVHRS